MNRKYILIGCGALVFVCLICIGFIALVGGGAILLTQPVVNAGNDYLEAVKAGDYATAYEMSAPSIQDEMGSVEGLQTFFVENNFAPESWSFSSRSIENNTGTLAGSATLQDGTKVDLEMNFVKVDDTWKVTRLFFESQ